jgi:hypothetical protein
MEGKIMSSRLPSHFGRIVALAVLFACTPAAPSETVTEYGFAEAAQEVTQLFWLAETATACGWASAEDTVKFKYFTVRFLAAHLSSNNRMALVSLVTEDGYEDKVRRAALQSAQDNCVSSRWHSGWTAYKAAADLHDQEF